VQANDEIKNAPSDHRSTKVQVEDECTNASCHIDRYHFLEEYIPRLLAELQDRQHCMEKLREQLEAITQQLDEEECNAEPAMQKLIDAKVEEKRLWDVMTKDDIRELGRRYPESKRRRLT
jgi:hypothetical protein